MALSFDPDALTDIPKQDAQRILDKCEWLWANRHSVAHHPLKSNLEGLCKRRLGKYRIIYSYDNEVDNLVIRLAGLRDDIYEVAAERLE